jgi:hypothetical protein
MGRRLGGWIYFQGHGAIGGYCDRNQAQCYPSDAGGEFDARADGSLVAEFGAAANLGLAVAVFAPNSLPSEIRHWFIGALELSA